MSLLVCSIDIVVTNKGDWSMLSMTHHAQARLQQRGIPPDIVENLLDFGHEAHSHNGSRIVYFDHRARQQRRRQAGKSARNRTSESNRILMPMPLWPIPEVPAGVTRLDGSR